jgi:hypothetical protein
VSVTVSVHQHVDMAGEGKGLAVYYPERDTLSIWPQGMGIGPMLSMTLKDWARLNDEVRLAMMRADRLSGYTATEGNGDEL